MLMMSSSIRYYDVIIVILICRDIQKKTGKSLLFLCFQWIKLKFGVRGNSVFVISIGSNAVSALSFKKMPPFFYLIIVFSPAPQL